MTPSFLYPLARPNGDFISTGRGDGAIVWDTDGNQHLDAMASLWYCAIWHGRAEMAKAIADHSLTFCPPLITTDRQVDQIIDTLATAAAE